MDKRCVQLKQQCFLQSVCSNYIFLLLSGKKHAKTAWHQMCGWKWCGQQKQSMLSAICSNCTLVVLIGVEKTSKNCLKQLGFKGLVLYKMLGSGGVKI